jgi:catalase-peroxidase
MNARTIQRNALLSTAAAAALLLAGCGGAPESAETAAIGTDSPVVTEPLPAGEAPARFARGEAKPNDFWWPDQVDLRPLRQNAAGYGPDPDFDYPAAFEAVDYDELKADIEALMTQSQDWWPADYGHYGPFFVRMAWHSAGTYRVSDGRGGAGGGQQRFEPLNSWPDNANLDKARRLLWPVKKKYGDSVSWADLMVLTGNVAMESMGFETVGFAGGRTDDWEAELVYWGPEAEMLADERYQGDRELEPTLAAVQMGLIYVNPEGPNGEPDPLLAARDIRETFGRMAMNDEETVALIAGGHTFGKAHGAAKADGCIGPDPAANGITGQGVGWDNRCGTGKGADTITSGLEGAWTSNPTAWTTQYLDNLFEHEWVQTRSPGGAVQWIPANGEAAGTVPDAHDPAKTHAPIMFTTDLSLKEDPAYREIAKRFQEDPAEFEAAFARAWFKLTHRDMGPKARYRGGDAPEGSFVWQDPVPEADYAQIDAADVERLKRDVLATGLSVPALVRTAWASASTYRDTDMRGGANGARLRLAPQRDWAVNDAAEIGRVVAELEEVKVAFDAQGGGKRVSIADLIVIGGAAAIEAAAERAGHDVTVPVMPGRTDATEGMTDAASFAVLEPRSDGFRNHHEGGDGRAEALVDRADMLTLTVPEMTVLIGGLRALDANVGGVRHGVLTDRPGTLSNDVFVHLLDMNTAWSPTGEAGVFVGRDRSTGEERWTATETDLVFGSNAELRAVVEHYAYDGAEDRFVQDFVDAWTKVMRLDRYDLGGRA